MQRELGLSKIRKYRAYSLSYIFVDDNLIFCNGIRRDVVKLKEIIDLYCITIGPNINIGKYCVSLMGILEGERRYFFQLFRYHQIELEGLKYLVF
jgi:hypothetical protein